MTDYRKTTLISPESSSEPARNPHGAPRDRRGHRHTRVISRRVLFVFVDGLGVGADDRLSNPLAEAHLPNLRRIVDDGAGTEHSARPWWSAHALDATLGQPGLPQSGTGQTALLTGRNAPAESGRHYGPYPDDVCRGLLAEAGIWHKLKAAGKTVAFANAFPDAYLDRVRDGVARMGAVARSAHLAGVRLRGPDDLRDGSGVSAFYTNALWRSRLGYRDVPEITAREAGRRLSRLSRRHDFVLYETYETDVVGHRGAMADAVDALQRLDDFLGGVLDERVPYTTIVLASDHGNIEDMTTRRHTRNPVLAGWSGQTDPPDWRCITDVVPATLDALDIAPQPSGTAENPG